MPCDISRVEDQLFSLVPFNSHNLAPYLYGKQNHTVSDSDLYDNTVFLGNL